MPLAIPWSVLVPCVFPVAVGTDHVTARHCESADWLHPGLLTAAAKLKVSSVPTVAVVGLIEMLMPEIIVTVALAVFVESACPAPLIVAVAGIPVVPLVLPGR